MRKYLYPFLLLGFGAAVVTIFLFKSASPVPVPPLKARQGDLALGGEWLNTKKAVQGLRAKLRQDPNDHQSRLLLAQAYLQEGRVTGDHPYYDAAALQLLEQVLADQPDNFDALCSQASLCLTQHHFAQGLALAERAAKINPYSAYVYGLLCDAHVELGHYDEAVRMADRMNQVRPDLRAYARVSYLRELHGDVPGAIQAMGMATEAGYVGLEQTEWTRVQLGQLHENRGELDQAENLYQQSLQVRPFYAYALAGLSRVAAARRDYPAAIKYLEQARATVKDYAFADELADLYRLHGQPAEAEKMAKESIAMLAGAAQEADENEQLGHYADRELAYAYVKTGELDWALKHAQIEYERRPDN
uniref:tetratricopeptide repeat protein n=1 Tax=Hymenobacter sp. B1770 TaxID=1718788 RepID=UPI003CEB1EA6